ncbi:MAG: hypothetical protein ACE14M_13485 [Terriglobales bacterium]
MAIGVDVPRCQHVRINGVQCGSPALRGKKACFYHHQLQLRFARRARARRRNGKGLSLPILEDAASIQAALMQTINAILDDTIDRKTGALVLYGLQTASSNLNKIMEPYPGDMVT